MPTLVEKLNEFRKYELGAGHYSGLRDLKILDTFKYGNPKRQFQVCVRTASRAGILGAHYLFSFFEVFFARDLALSVSNGDYDKVQKDALLVALYETCKYVVHKLSDEMFTSLEELPPIRKANQ